MPPFAARADDGLTRITRLAGSTVDSKPFLGGQRPAPGYAMNLTEEQRTRLARAAPYYPHRGDERFDRLERPGSARARGARVTPIAYRKQPHAAGAFTSLHILAVISNLRSGGLIVHRLFNDATTLLAAIVDWWRPRATTVEHVGPHPPAWRPDIGLRMLSAALVLGACAGPADSNSDPEPVFREQLGRPWELVSLGPRAIPPPPPGTPPDSPSRDLVPGRRPTIRFTAEPESAGGRSFCNGYGSPYELSRDSLRLPRIESSAVGCDGPDSLETRFFRALSRTRRFTIDSTRLVLIADDGAQLVFVPATDAGPTP
jgi:hypothetical protein